METENVVVQENENVPKPQAAPEAATAENANPAPKKNKKALILGIGIPALVILLVVGILIGISVYKSSQFKTALEYLDDGDIEEAVEIHKKLGDYKDLKDAIVDASVDEFDNELDDNSFKKALKIYAAVADYPEAIEEMDSKLERFISKQFRNNDLTIIQDLYAKAAKNDAALDRIAGFVAEASKDLLKNYEYYYFVEIYNMVSDQKDAVAAMDKIVIERIKILLDENVYDVISLNDALRDYGIQIDGIQSAMYNKGMEMLDDGNYDDASDVFYSLSQCNYEDSFTKYAECNLRYYLINEWYDSAKSYIDDFDGEVHESLLAIYMSYCADATVIQDLEAAVKERLELEASGADYQALLDAENSYLEQYNNMPFYDSELENLVNDYLDYLYYQQYYVDNYRNLWQLPYYLGQYDAQRYEVLTTLNEFYGFGEDDPELQAIIGTAEKVYAQCDAWYDLFDDLRYELEWLSWNSTGYLEIINHTEHTFSAVVTIEYSDSSGEVVNTMVYEIVDYAPQDVQKLDIGVENAADLNWNITVEITSID